MFAIRAFNGSHDFMMKALIFTEGGTKYGLGHIIRCSALYDELEKRGITVTMVINCDIPLRSLLGGRNYHIATWYDTIDEYIVPGCFAAIDSYHAPVSAYRIVSEKCNALFIDDTNRMEYPAGIIVNPGIGAKKIPYNLSDGHRYLLGSNYTILRSEFRKSVIPERTVNKELTNILVMLGGSDVCNLTPCIMEHLTLGRYKQIKKHIVVGSGFQNIEQIKSASATGDCFELYYNSDALKLKELMEVCDFAITTAGQTINELIATRLPFICIKAADNQELNVQALIDLKLISSCYECVENEDRHCFADWLDKQICILESYEGRKASFEMLLSLNIAEGTGNIVNEWVGADYVSV